MSAPPPARSFHAWRPGDLAGGHHQGTRPVRAGLRLRFPVGTRRYADLADAGEPRTFAWASWTSPVRSPSHDFTSLVPSWNARTPDDAWLEVEARVTADPEAAGGWSRWYVLGRWAESDATVHATSVPGQDDAAASVDTEELLAPAGVRWGAYQLRVVLHRGVTSDAEPEVSLVGAVACDGTAQRARASRTPSPAGPAVGVELAVPAHSQMIHHAEVPHATSGGGSWCSPTSTTMVLRSWGLGPSAAECAWVPTAVDVDRFVVHAARCVFDHGFGGAGNWSFNAAYAARYGVEAIVTRLSGLDEAEELVAAGVPVVASLSFAAEDLPGAGYATAGHLLVVRGLTDDGDVVCNDPASHLRASNDEVRVVYDRAAFERLWLGSSGGVAYVMHPADVPLPPVRDPQRPGW